MKGRRQEAVQHVHVEHLRVNHGTTPQLWKVMVDVVDDVRAEMYADRRIMSKISENYRKIIQEASWTVQNAPDLDASTERKSQNVNDDGR